MSRLINPRFEWLLVELTIAWIAIAGGVVVFMNGCDGCHARGQELRALPAGAYQARDVAGETAGLRRGATSESQYRSCGPAQYVQVPGPMGPAGPAGPPGRVDYDAVKQEIRNQVGEADNVLRMELRASLETIRTELSDGYSRADAELADRINQQSTIVGQWQARIDALAERPTTPPPPDTRPGSGDGHSPPTPLPGSNPGSWPPVDVPTLILLGLGAAGIGVPVWVGYAARAAWLAAKYRRPRTEQPAVGGPPPPPFRSAADDASTESASEAVADCDRESAAAASDDH